MTSFDDKQKEILDMLMQKEPQTLGQLAVNMLAFPEELMDKIGPMIEKEYISPEELSDDLLLRLTDMGAKMVERTL